MTGNLPFDSDMRGGNHPLVISFHSLWTKSNKRTRGQFKCDTTWFCFSIDFVRLHAQHHLERGVREFNNF